MKKLLLLVIVTASALTVQAQTSRGTVALTGTLGYSQHKDSAEKEQNGARYESDGYSYTLAPSIGYFIKDNLELGVSFQLYKYKSESSDPTNTFILSDKSENKYTDYSVYARQYKFLTEKLAVHGTLKAGLSNREDLRDILPHTGLANQGHYRNDHYTTFSAALSPGLTFFASNKVGLTASFGALQYSRKKTEMTSVSDYSTSPWQRHVTTYKSNVLELDFSSMNLNFGLSYFIGK